MLNGVSHVFPVAFMYLDPADKLVEDGGGKFSKIGIAFRQLHKPLRPSSRVLKNR